MATEIIRPAGLQIRRDVSLTTSGKLLNREFAPTTKRILLRIISLGATVESITDDNVESNCSIIDNIPPKGESFSDFIATFAMSVGFDTYFYLQH